MSVALAKSITIQQRHRLRHFLAAGLRGRKAAVGNPYDNGKPGRGRTVKVAVWCGWDGGWYEGGGRTVEGAVRCGWYGGWYSGWYGWYGGWYEGGGRTVEVAVRARLRGLLDDELHALFSEPWVDPRCQPPCVID